MDINQLIEICQLTDKERRDSKLRGITKDAIADILAKSSSTPTMDRPSADLTQLKECMAGMMEEMKNIRMTNERVVGALEKVEKIKRWR